MITRTPDHQYLYEGQSYPGVTGVLKILDKSDALVAWASRMTAEAAIANIGTLPQLLASVGPEGVVKALTSRSAWTSRKAMDLGSDVHDLADRYVRGEALPDVPGEAMDRIKGYAEWWRSSGWTLRTSEALLVSPGAGYGGTLDLLCRDRDGRTVLADIKSGNIDYRGKIYDSIALQLAAYGSSELIQVGGTVFAMPRIDRYAVIHVRADGVTEREVALGADDVAGFRACLALWRWHEGYKARGRE